MPKLMIWPSKVRRLARKQKRLLLPQLKSQETRRKSKKRSSSVRTARCGGLLSSNTFFIALTIVFLFSAVEVGCHGDEEIDFSTLSLDKLRKIANKDGPYYPVVEGCDNPYRDGYITEPPKKPRASYLFFQAIMRSYYAKRNPDASVSELMALLGDKWRGMSEQEQAPFIQLAREEAELYETERALMEKAQKPNEMWQPLRRCLMVLDRLVKDSFAEIFLEPVDQDEFPDYGELIDFPMDLGTIRQKLADRKYQAPENFARDVRKVRLHFDVHHRSFFRGPYYAQHL